MYLRQGNNLGYNLHPNGSTEYNISRFWLNIPQGNNLDYNLHSTGWGNDKCMHYHNAEN